MIMAERGKVTFSTYTYGDVTPTILQTSLEHYYANLFAFLRGHERNEQWKYNHFRSMFTFLVTRGETGHLRLVPGRPPLWENIQRLTRTNFELESWNTCKNLDLASIRLFHNLWIINLTKAPRRDFMWTLYICRALDAMGRTTQSTYWVTSWASFKRVAAFGKLFQSIKRNPLTLWNLNFVSKVYFARNQVCDQIISQLGLERLLSSRKIACSHWIRCEAKFMLA